SSLLCSIFFPYTKLFRSFLDIKIRVLNVIDLMRLQSSLEHPHGLSDKEYDLLFTKDKPIIFAFHGYPNLIHLLTYKRKNKNLHVDRKSTRLNSSHVSI